MVAVGNQVTAFIVHTVSAHTTAAEMLNTAQAKAYALLLRSGSCFCPGYRRALPTCSPIT